MWRNINIFFWSPREICFSSETMLYGRTEDRNSSIIAAANHSKMINVSHMFFVSFIIILLCVIPRD